MGDGDHLSGEEGFLEGLHNLRSRRNKVDESFNDRLSGKVLRFSEDYADGRFGIILYLHRRGQPDSHWMALCLDRCLGPVDHTPPVSSLHDQPALKADNVGSGDQQPVLVDVVELPEMPNVRGVPTRYLVRLYFVEDEPLGLWEGLMYRRVASFGVVETGLKLLPRFMSWKGYSATRQSGANGASPDHKKSTALFRAWTASPR